jgi:hypothetical protein
MGNGQLSRAPNPNITAPARTARVNGSFDSQGLRNVKALRRLGHNCRKVFLNSHASGPRRESLGTSSHPPLEISATLTRILLECRSSRSGRVRHTVCSFRDSGFHGGSLEENRKKRSRQRSFSRPEPARSEGDFRSEKGIETRRGSSAQPSYWNGRTTGPSRTSKRRSTSRRRPWTLTCPVGHFIISLAHIGVPEGRPR